MRVAICDDDINCINDIEKFLKGYKKPSIESDAYLSGESLVCAYKEHGERYDAIFLDMEMESLNGIETAKEIRQIDEYVIIVFVTSHTEYMRESFKCAPFRFLVKPLDDKEFCEVLGDIVKKLSEQRKVFAFTENKAKIRLFCDDITYCESQDHNVLIFTKDNKYRISKTLGEIEAQLDNKMFCRVHKSFIINFRYIKTIKGNDAQLYYCDRLIPISRSYKKTVLEEYTNFLERDFGV